MWVPQIENFAKINIVGVSFGMNQIHMSQTQRDLVLRIPANKIKQLYRIGS